MKTNFKKVFAGLLAMSAICCTPSFQANAAAPNVSAVNVASVPMGPGNAIVASLPAKTSTTPREAALISAVKDAANYYYNLGFTYNNHINYYNSSAKKSDVTYATTVYVATDASGGTGNAVSQYGLITLGPKASYMNELYTSGDAIAHEYTHLVTQQMLNWSYRNSNTAEDTESNAIIEAYSDILGELSETRPDWKMGTSLFSNRSYCLRDLSSPNSTKTPFSSSYTYNIKYYTKADEFRTDAKANNLHTSNGNGGNIYSCYTGSTVLSHAAYLMYSYGLSRDDLANIWYRSLNYFDKNKGAITFEDCRTAVTKAANSYLSKYSKADKLEKMRKISEAFDSAHIYKPVELDPPTIAQNTLKQSSAANGTRMSDFMRSSSYKYPNGYYWTTDDVNTASRIRVGKSNGITIGPTFKRNFDTSFNYLNEEPYYQCAGFARKLQQEFFETTTFLQLSEDGNFQYIPRIGDHLRVGPVGYSPWDFGHSIFISSVTKKSNTSYSFTYCDCNADADDKIKYNLTGTLTRSGSNMTIKLGTTEHTFKWVERPVMVGDVNGDSYVNSKDITVMQKIVNNGYYSELSTTDVHYRNNAADLNNDGRVNSSDLTALKNAVKSGVDYIANYTYLK